MKSGIGRFGASQFHWSLEKPNMFCRGRSWWKFGGSLGAVLKTPSWWKVFFSSTAFQMRRVFLLLAAGHLVAQGVCVLLSPGTLTTQRFWEVCFESTMSGKLGVYPGWTWCYFSFWIAKSVILFPAAVCVRTRLLGMIDKWVPRISFQNIIFFRENVDPITNSRDLKRIYTISSRISKPRPQQLATWKNRVLLIGPSDWGKEFREMSKFEDGLDIVGALRQTGGWCRCCATDSVDTAVCKKRGKPIAEAGVSGYREGTGTRHWCLPAGKPEQPLINSALSVRLSGKDVQRIFWNILQS